MSVLDVERFLRLPLRAKETWQGGSLRLPHCLDESPDTPVRASAAAWICCRTGLLGGSSQVRRQGSVQFEHLWEALLQLALDNESPLGYRPGRLEMEDRDAAARLSEILAGSGTAVEYRERLLAFRSFAEGMAEQLAPELVAPSLLDAKGTTIDRIRAFADAARLYYDARPWLILTNSDLVEVESPRLAAEHRFASVMGNGGQEFGILFSPSREAYWRRVDCTVHAQPVAEHEDHWVVNFSHFTEIPTVDLDLWMDHDLPVAGPRAYPTAGCYSKARGLKKRPGPKALTWFEGLLRALAASTEEEIDSGRWQKRVESFGGPVEYRLSLPFLLDPPDHRTLARHGMIDPRASEPLLADVSRLVRESGITDPDELNKLLRGVESGPGVRRKHAPSNATEEAQDLCYQAAGAVGRRRVHLARQALQIHADCADAYVILAENAGDEQKAADLYASGVEAGRRALGESYFEENMGNFWGAVETRGFMRALIGFGECADGLGRTAEALATYRELLRLNPNDNQNVRVRLLPLCLRCGRDAEAEALIRAYAGDRSAIWNYSRALLAYRRDGKTSASLKLLKKALSENRHVAELFVTGDLLPPVSGGYDPEIAEEAVVCVFACREAWVQTDGALEWLADSAGLRLDGEEDE